MNEEPSCAAEDPRTCRESKTGDRWQVSDRTSASGHVQANEVMREGKRGLGHGRPARTQGGNLGPQLPAFSARWVHGYLYVEGDAIGTSTLL